MTTSNTTISDTGSPTVVTGALRLPTASAPVYTTILDTELGSILATSDGICLTGLYLEVSDEIDARLRRTFGSDPTPAGDLEIFHRTETQLGEYFAGRRTRFDLPLAAKGTEFQRSVWQALTLIPFGRTAGYGELAGNLGRPGAARAVGAANGKNPISIIVPCHRVIGADGSMTGYAWGEEKKRHLLNLESSP
ncbi:MULTISPECIES: methylated-DNA--[protein]-cysteine S-methyltransferase [unclassified Brevibacterium]|uniref:methylated-DNA--[protein]-cysteine S-methyltransferase n=1 Tax=unclassified Brevibacterium TaxID=2614124 RepID=UPI0010927732|nr:methylated-DNA--[protein]-cysteine S-methyltransferase [Brevibacterium sp. S22]TGD31271.1 methylated-DNA--[protein]-cysteine S-methyltransferase [Brevibacterium sp. S22]